MMLLNRPGIGIPCKNLVQRLGVYEIELNHVSDEFVPLTRQPNLTLADNRFAIVDLLEMKMSTSLPVGKSPCGVFILRPSDLEVDDRSRPGDACR